jgi:ubiquitin thioesterase OTU1
MEKECVKADGNCLFNCATLALEGTVSKPQETREILASVMLSDPLNFSKSELGRDPEEYIKWLTGSSSAWGGIPELKALSMVFECEFGVVVISDIEVLLFGKDKGYKSRVYVLYDGTHYNLITHQGKRQFDPQDEPAYQGCLELARGCKQRHEDVDTSVFSLMCY